MKLKMAENSLFAILLRSPWWISMAIAAVFGLLAFAVLPQRYAPFGAVGALPFFVIGAMAAWRQSRQPSAAMVKAALEQVRAMSWREFSEVMEDALRRDGYTVTRLNGSGADFEARRGGRTALVSCKRWKAVNAGVEPLRELHAEAERREAHESIFVTAGDVTLNAGKFAAEHNIRQVQGADLARMLHASLAARP